MLEISNLTKRYDDVLAVDDVSLTVKEGELFSILGPSGSGKSSLLECIAGLEFPQTGTIQIKGENVTNWPPSERDTSMVFQNLALFPHMTVQENIAYGLKRQNVEKSERQSLIDEYLELVDMAGYEDRAIEELSGGEQQRVALARSLVVQPEILLLDEALASLDQQLRVQLQDELYRVQRELDQTMIYVTHDQTVAFSISDRVAVMNQGQSEQIGRPEELYENPETPFIAGFVGNSNSFTGTVTTLDMQQAVVDISNHETSIRGRAINADVVEGSEVTAIVKLGDIDINATNGETNSFIGTVKNRKYLGETSNLLVELDIGLTLNAMTNDPWEHNVEDELEVSWEADDCLIYLHGGT